jgi:YHS domain-containing protein
MTSFAPLRRTALALGLGLAALAAPMTVPAFAYDETKTTPVNVDAQGVALRGFDPVAYFTVGKPTKGDAQFSAKHEGATYHFSSAANRDAFAKEPAKYAPAFGGFCALGASFEKKIDGDPALWSIVDGKLYVNVHAKAVEIWKQDVPGNIKKADGAWPKIRDKAPKDL